MKLRKICSLVPGKAFLRGWEEEVIEKRKKIGKRCDSPVPRCLPKDLTEWRDFPPASFSNSSLLLLGKRSWEVLPELREEPLLYSVGELEHTSLLPRQPASSDSSHCDCMDIEGSSFIQDGIFPSPLFFLLGTAPFPY